MTAMPTSMRDFIETLRLHVPRDLHSCGQEAILRWFAEMRDAVDDLAAVVGLARRVRGRVVQELRWEAESAQSARAFGDAHRLRRQAERFEASHV